jgi:hypothetical protein
VLNLYLTHRRDRPTSVAEFRVLLEEEDVGACVIKWDLQ